MIYEGCMHKVSFNVIPCKDVGLGTAREISAALGSQDRRLDIEIYIYTLISSIKAQFWSFEFG